MNVTTRKYSGAAGMAIVQAMLILTVSCGGSGSSTGKDSDSAAVAADSVAKAPAVRLADTVYSSADAIKYRVELLDTTADSRLSSIEDPYAGVPGIFTFRGTQLRDAPFSASVDKAPSAIEVAWRFRTGSDKKWGGGSGWTGQPLYVKWRQGDIDKFRAAGVVHSGFNGEEIIVGSLDGKVYFINPADGTPTRPAIETGNPIKGTVSLDPTMNGYLYVGQGIPNTTPFGAVTIDLNSNSIISHFGKDTKAQRGWGAYDSSAVRAGQYVFRPGENGTLYKWLPTAGGMVLQSALRYTGSGAAPGIESSLAVWRNYGYFNDNAGNVLCVNLDTMRPVWHYDNHDDSDSTPVIVEENGKPYLYTGCEIDKQGDGYGYYVKLDALDGSLVWQQKVAGRKWTSPDKKHFDGGFYATPLPGRADCKGILFANVVTNIPACAGKMIALSMADGKILWERQLKTYAWSSPAAIVTADGKMYLFTGDTAGNAYIIDPRTGEIITSAAIGSNFESSPIAVGNSIFVGSRGDTIFKLTLK